MYFLKVITALILVLIQVLPAIYYFFNYSLKESHKDQFNCKSALAIFAYISSFSGILPAAVLLYKDFAYMFVLKHIFLPYIIALPATLCLIYFLCRFTPKQIKTRINETKPADSKFGFAEYYIFVCALLVFGFFFTVLYLCGYENLLE